MKKIFTFLFAAVLAVGVWAQDEIPQLNFTQSREEPGGVVTFIWQGDASLSTYYYLTMSYVDMTTYVKSPISLILGSTSAFAVQGYDGYFGFTTSYMCEYGTTYPKIKDNPQISDSDKAAFQAGWAHVNSDLSLEAGYYYLTVTGYAADKTTVTEKMGYAVLQVNGPAEAIENIFESKKPVKFIENGEVRILRDGKVYNMSGALVR